MSEQPNAKPVSDSVTEQVQVVMPPHLNGRGDLFGGQLAMWIDVVAGIVARRHSRKTVITAAIDNLRFREPVHQNEMVVLRGKVTYVGRTSMEIRVDSYVENRSGCRLINTAFVILVALDESGKPCPVPGLIRQTPEEEKAYQAGARRREMRERMYRDLYE